MSGHRKFSELTEHFTPKDRKIVEDKKLTMRAALQRLGKPSRAPSVTPQHQEQTSRGAIGR